MSTQQPPPPDMPTDLSGAAPAEVGEAAASTPANQVQYDALQDQMLRLAADYDNFRKRARREQEDVKRFGIEGLLKDMLPIFDNLDRALVHSTNDKDPVIAGIRMVVKQFQDVLAQYHVVAFTSVGQPFDPARHEAVGQEPSETVPAQAVARELQQGYMIHDRLLRPARVMVAVPPTAGDTNH